QSPAGAGTPLRDRAVPQGTRSTPRTAAHGRRQPLSATRAGVPRSRPAAGGSVRRLRGAARNPRGGDTILDPLRADRRGASLPCGLSEHSRSAEQSHRTGSRGGPAARPGACLGRGRPLRIVAGAGVSPSLFNGLELDRPEPTRVVASTASGIETLDRFTADP